MIVSSLSRCPHRQTPLCFLSESSRDTESGRWPVGTHFGWLTPTGLSTDPPGSSKVTHDSSGLVFAREANPFCKQVSGPHSTRQPRSPEARQRWGDRHGPHLQHLLVGEHSLHTNIFAELLWNSHTVIHTPPHGPFNGARSHSGSLPGNGVRVRRADKEFANVPLSILAPLVHIPEVPLIVWRIMSGKF